MPHKDFLSGLPGSLSNSPHVRVNDAVGRRASDGVAKQMGHADWTMIARVYGKWMPDANTGAGSRAVAMFAEASNDTGSRRAKASRERHSEGH